jgi:ATP:ADP antiporter, AAA family
MKPKSIVRGALRVVADLHDDERETALLMTVNGFLLLMAYSCIKPVREALILAHPGGAEYKAYTAGATPLLLLLAVPLYSRASAGLARNRLVIGTTLFFTAHLLAFYVVGAAMESTLAFGLAFYLWIAIFNMMTVAQFWAFANDLYTEEQGRRLLPLLGFGVSLGAVAGAATAKLLIARLGALPMMPLAAAILMMSACVFQLVHTREVRRAPSPSAKAAATEVVGGRAGDAFRAVMKDRYLLYIAAFSLVFTLVKTNGDYVLARTVENAAEQAVAAGTLPASQVQNYIGGVFASLTFWTDMISLALQGLAVSRVIKHFGFGLALCALPMIALGDATMMVAWPVLAAVRIGKTAESAIDYSLNNTIRNMLWLPTSRRAKYLAKQATDTFFVRAGDMSSAGLIFVSAYSGLSPRAVALSNVLLILVWVVLAAGILKERELLLGRVSRRPESAGRMSVNVLPVPL